MRRGAHRGAKLSVLFFTLAYEPSQAGGAERQARLQAEELARRGHRMCVVCPRGPGTRSGPVGPVYVRRLPRFQRSPWRKPSYALMLAAWLLVRGRRYDVWHVHLASRQADWVVALGKLLGRPTYVKIASGGETGEVQQGDRTAWLTRRTGLRRANRVQALSGEIVAELQQIGVRAEKIVRIPNGLDLRTFRPSPTESRRGLRDRLELPERGPIVLYTGRLVEYKGVGDLLLAWRDVAGASDAALVLLGARTMEDQPLKVPIEGPCVLVRSWTDQVVDYLHAADVFVYPPHQDGMSNALLEAMACGLPPVATRIGAVEGLLTHGENSLLVAPRAPAELAAALLDLVQDGALRERLGRGALQTAREYAVEDVVSQVERTYGELVDSC